MIHDMRRYVPNAADPGAGVPRHQRRGRRGKSITIIIPVLNEEAVLDALVEELLSALETQNFSWTVLFVDDGSSDGSLARLKGIHAVDTRFTLISLSRNFGKEIAITAGLRHASGDAVIIMDGDLQHPPSVIPKLVERWREGYRVVFAQRDNRDYENFLRRLCAGAFYAIFQRVGQAQLPVGSGDFVLLDRKAVDAINEIGERARFCKGLYGWIGFPSAGVPFSPKQRAIGHSRWSLFKLTRFAIDGLISFSNVPLKMWSLVGALISLSALIYAAYFMICTMIFGPDIAGFPSLIVSIMFFSGVQLISLGFIGEYLARVYEEVKARPLYIVAEEIGAPGQATASGWRETYSESRQSGRPLHHPLRGRFRNDEGYFGRDPLSRRSGAAVGNQRDSDDHALVRSSQGGDASARPARHRTPPQFDLWPPARADARPRTGRHPTAAGDADPQGD